MKKDWMIWIWCLLLFFAGVTWGSIRLKNDFYTVDNIHDLFEIFSSGATVVAVIFAAYSVNNWRSQIKAESDHELARKLAISLINYKESIQSSYSDAQFCVNHCIVGFEGLPPELLKSVIDSFLVRMDKNLNEKSELLALLIEVRALWGEELPSALSGVINACNDFHGCVRLFSAAIGPLVKFEQQDIFKRRIIETGEEFSKKGWHEGEVLAKLNELSKFADDYIKAKLVR